MCKVKSGKSIHNEQDLNNLIKGLIFRQEMDFSEEKIFNLLEKHTEGSPLNISQERKNS